MVFWGLVDSAALEGRDKVQRNKNSFDVCQTLPALKTFSFFAAPTAFGLLDRRRLFGFSLVNNNSSWFEV